MSTVNYQLSSSSGRTCLADMLVPGKLDNKNIFRIASLKFHRRQLHLMNPKKYGIRSDYGRSMSMGVKRGSIGIHKKYGIGYVGGSSGNRITLCHLKDGNRISKKLRIEHVKILTYNNWKFYICQR